MQNPNRPELWKEVTTQSSQAKSSRKIGDFNTFYRKNPAKYEEIQASVVEGHLRKQIAQANPGITEEAIQCKMDLLLEQSQFGNKRDGWGSKAGWGIDGGAGNIEVNTGLRVNLALDQWYQDPTSRLLHHRIIDLVRHPTTGEHRTFSDGRVVMFDDQGHVTAVDPKIGMYISLEPRFWQRHAVTKHIYHHYHISGGIRIDTSNNTYYALDGRTITLDDYRCVRSIDLNPVRSEKLPWDRLYVNSAPEFWHEDHRSGLLYYHTAGLTYNRETDKYRNLSGHTLMLDQQRRIASIERIPSDEMPWMGLHIHLGSPHHWYEVQGSRLLHYRFAGLTYNADTSEYRTLDDRLIRIDGQGRLTSVDPKIRMYISSEPRFWHQDPESGLLHHRAAYLSYNPQTDEYQTFDGRLVEIDQGYVRSVAES